MPKFRKSLGPKSWCMPINRKELQLLVYLCTNAMASICDSVYDLSAPVPHKPCKHYMAMSTNLQNAAMVSQLAAAAIWSRAFFMGKNGYWLWLFPQGTSLSLPRPLISHFGSNEYGWQVKINMWNVFCKSICLLWCKIARYKSLIISKARGKASRASECSSRSSKSTIKAYCAENTLFLTKHRSITA